MYDYYCRLGVAMYAQSRPDMRNFTRDEFSWSESNLAIVATREKVRFYRVLYKVSND